MTRLLLIAIWSFISLMVPIFTYGEETAMRIATADGKTTDVILSSKPEIYYQGSDVLISNTEISYSWRIKDIENITFVKLTSDVASTFSDKLFVSYKDRHLYVWGIEEVDRLRLYDIDGFPVKCRVSCDNDCVDMDLTDYIDKIILVTIPGHKTFKLIIK